MRWRSKIRMGLIVGIAGCMASGARGQTTLGDFTDSPILPDTPLARLARRVIDTINSNDPEQVRALVNDGFAREYREGQSMDDHLAAFARFFSASGGYDFVSVRSYQPTRPLNELIVIVRTRAGGTYRGMQFTIDDENPPRLSAFMVSPARPPKDALGPKVRSDDEIAAAVRRHVEELVSRDTFSGVVLLAHNGKPFLELAEGLADRERHEPIHINTRFNIASMGKMFTAVAVAQLVEQNRLSFDDQIFKFLGEDWLASDVGRKIRVGQLLSHTSGLGDFLEKLYEDSGTFTSIRDHQRLVRDESPAFEPGTRWSYSNTGYLLLGALIENVTGMSYYDYMQKNVFASAGMNESGWRGVGQQPTDQAIGYSRITDKLPKEHWESNARKLRGIGTSAGGAVTTVGDLLKFAEALRLGKLVKPETVELLWTAKPASPGYGYGFAITSERKDRIVSHSGGIWGVSGHMDIYVRSGYTVIVLSNMDYVAEAVAEFTRNLINQRLNDEP